MPPNENNMQIKTSQYKNSSRWKKITTFLKFTTFLVATTFLNSCGRQHKLPTGEGYINVDGGKVWYRVTGTGDKTPILVLHGGPGIPSYYLKPLEALGKDRQVVFFDQLGCGKIGRAHV